MPRKVISGTVNGLLVGWLILAAVIGWQVFRAYRSPMLDIRLDEQLTVQPNPLLDPIVLAPLVGRQLETIDNAAVASIQDVRRLIARKPLELWFRPLEPGGERMLVVWAFARRIPDLRLSERFAIPVEASELGASLGLEAGDRVLRVNDEILGNPADYLPAMRKLVASPQRLSVVRDRVPSPIELVVQVQDQWMNVVIFTVGLAFGLLGFAAYRLRPNARSTLAFFVFTMTCSLLWFVRSVPFDNRTVLERHLLVVLRLALPVAAGLLVLRFTALRGIVTRPLLAVLATAIVSATLGVWNIVRHPSAAAEGVLGPPVSELVLLLTLGMILASLSGDWLAWLLRRRLLPIDRQRGKVLRLATVVGFVPLTLYFLLRFDLRLWCEVAVILFPLILAYAAIRRNLFQINELLFEAFLYGGLLIGVSVAYATLVASVAPLLDAAFGWRGYWTTSGLVAATAFAALPVHNRLRHQLNRQFERHQLSADLLVEAGSGATQSIASRHEYCGEMARRVAAALGTSDVHILVRSPESDEWKLAARTTTGVIEPTIDECRPLLDLVAERGQDVVRDVLEDELLSTAGERRVIDAMNKLRASLAIPLKISGEVWGLLAIGDKHTATNYSLGEFRALRQIARELSLGLYRAILTFGFSDSPTQATVPLRKLLPPMPTSIGPYHIERRLGEGGLGVVYLGRRDDRLVAVKVLNDRARRDLKHEQRFRRECAILRELHHPNVLEVIDFELAPEQYLAIEYCSFGTIRDLLRRSVRLAPDVAVDIARQAARGLQAAAEIGVVHRDVNPRNLLRTSEGHVKVADFGIAHWDRELMLTTHELMGTPGYLSPELCEGRPVDWRSDQYALGITLFEMLAGRRPYGAARPVEVVAMHVMAPVPDLRDEGIGGIPDKLAETVARMMAKGPSARFESYDALIKALDSCHSSTQPQRA
jgi:GAF domain-containing protein